MGQRGLGRGDAGSWCSCQLHNRVVRYTFVAGCVRTRVCLANCGFDSGKVDDADSRNRVASLCAGRDFLYVC